MTCALRRVINCESLADNVEVTDQNSSDDQMTVATVEDYAAIVSAGCV